MKFELTNRDRGALRQGALFGRTRAVRLRSLILLHLADGAALSRLAALAGVSRPTVYRWARVFAHSGNPADLEPRGIARRDRTARGSGRTAPRGVADGEIGPDSVGFGPGI